MIYIFGHTFPRFTTAHWVVGEHRKVGVFVQTVGDNLLATKAIKNDAFRCDTPFAADFTCLQLATTRQLVEECTFFCGLPGSVRPKL